jgi:hypothetical protein
MDQMTASFTMNTAPLTTQGLPLAGKIEPSVVRGVLARWTEKILSKAEAIPFHEVGGL